MWLIKDLYDRVLWKIRRMGLQDGDHHEPYLPAEERRMLKNMKPAYAREVVKKMKPA